MLGNNLILGYDNSGNPIRLSPDDRARHLYAVGSTGTGKTKSLHFFGEQDILAWPQSHCGMLMLDLEGTLFDSLMGFLASHNLSRLPVSQTAQESMTASESAGWSNGWSHADGSTDAWGGFRGRSGGEGFGVSGKGLDGTKSFSRLYGDSNVTQSQSRYSANTDGTNYSRSRNRSSSSSEGRSGSFGVARSAGHAETHSHQSSDSYGESESYGENESDTQGVSGDKSWSNSSSMTLSARAF